MLVVTRQLTAGIGRVVLRQIGGGGGGGAGGAGGGVGFGGGGGGITQPGIGAVVIVELQLPTLILVTTQLSTPPTGVVQVVQTLSLVQSWQVVVAMQLARFLRVPQFGGTLRVRSTQLLVTTGGGGGGGGAGGRIRVIKSP